MGTYLDLAFTACPTTCTRSSRITHWGQCCLDNSTYAFAEPNSNSNSISDLDYCEYDKLAAKDLGRASLHVLEKAIIVWHCPYGLMDGGLSELYFQGAPRL